MAFNTIAVKGEFVQKELAAAAAITPGFLVERTSAGTIQAHSSAGQNAAKSFALEDALQGDALDDAYATSDRVQFGVFQRGAEVNALLANGETVVIGDFVESNGDGYLRKHTAAASAGEEYVECIVGQAVEALDMSGSSAADPASQRFLIEVV